MPGALSGLGQYPSFKGTVSVTLSNPTPCKDRNVRLTTVPLKPFL